MIDLRLPIRTYSLANMREHWAVRAKRLKIERQTAYICAPAFPVPCVITLTREGKKLLDDDNLRGAFKAIRDGIADRLGVHDNDPRVKWEYGQVVADSYGVRIQMREAA